MSKTWLSLLLALCLLLPTMNVDAGESSNEYFYSLNGKIIDCNKDGYDDMVIITYDPDSDGDQDIDIRVDLDVFDSYGDAIDSVSGYHTINNGDADAYSLYWAASGSDTYDFYVGLYDDLGNLQDEEWYDYGYDLDSGSDCGDEFVCNNGGTVPFGWVDDGYDDCGDGTDEGESGGNSDDEFVCDNGNTIPMDYYDDGYDDCGDGSDEPGMNSSEDFVCDNGETIPIHWYDDGYDDCGDGSDEPNGVDSGDDEDDSFMSMGLPTGQLGFIMDELDEGDYEDAPEDYVIDFITPHIADISVTANFNINSEESDLLREDIILATKLKEIEAYFVEGRTAIAADYLAGNTDDEETAEAFMSLYENATTSVIPEYTPDSSDFSFEFNTAELIREFVEFDDVTITVQDLDTYYDVAWGGGMNNMLTVDLALSFMIITLFVAAFDENINMTDEEVEAGTAEMFLTSLMTCPETTTGFNAMICVMKQMDANPLMSEIFGGEEEEHLNFEAYCLHNTNQMITDTDDENPSCSAGTTTAFYNMSEDEISGFVMDEVNGLDEFGFLNEPGGFPLEIPDIAMSIINTENVLGKFSDNTGKVVNIEIGMVVSVIFPGIYAGDAHTFVIDPELNEEILENVTTIQVSPPNGYTFGNDSADNTVNVENDDELITWTFIKTNEVDATNMTDEEIEEIEESQLSELPGPSLIIGILTIFVVAFTRRRL